MKKLALFVMTLFAIGLSPVPASAQVLDPVCQDNRNATLCKDNADTNNQNEDNNEIVGSDGIIIKVAEFLLIGAGIIGVVMIAIGGVQFALSGGDTQKVKRARDLIIYAIVGLVVAVLAQQIIVFVLSRL